MDLWDAMVGLEKASAEVILVVVESAWLYPGIFLMSVFDAVIPAVPSESAVIAASSVWSHEGARWLDLSSPWLPAIWFAALSGAWLGDQLAYRIGATIDVKRFRWFRGRRGIAVLAWAEHSLERRGITFIIAGRHIPFGRVAVNISAGALGYPYRRFMVIDAIAVTIWATWTVALGTFAGALFDDSLLISVLVSIAAGIGLGLLVEKILAKFGLAPPDLPDITADIDAMEPPTKEVERLS